jgi:uncharacterized protein (TIGR00369 family)
MPSGFAGSLEISRILCADDIPLERLEDQRPALLSSRGRRSGQQRGLIFRRGEGAPMVSFTAQDPDFEVGVRRSFARLTLMRTIGARLLRVVPGDVEIDLPFRDDLTQHHGFLAAAVLTAIADVACGYAAISLMPAGADGLTVEFKVNFVAPAEGERMVARARVVRPGRTVTACAADVFAVTGGQEKLVATMLATIIQVSAERGTSPQHGEQRVHRGLREPAAHRSSRKARSWCVCRGHGWGHRLREITGLGQR